MIPIATIFFLFDINLSVQIVTIWKALTPKERTSMNLYN